MRVIPIKLDDKEYNLVIILEEANLKQIKMFDPATVSVKEFDDFWKRMKMQKIIVCSLSIPEMREFNNYASKNFKEAIDWLFHNKQNGKNTSINTTTLA